MTLLKTILNVVVRSLWSGSAAWLALDTLHDRWAAVPRLPLLDCAMLMVCLMVIVSTLAANTAEDAVLASARAREQVVKARRSAAERERERKKRAASAGTGGE